MTTLMQVLVLAPIVPLALLASQGKQMPPLEVVPSVDLARYAGKWYEIARLPNRFQRDCAGDTTATYSLRPDGKITVLNQCRTAKGRTKTAEGTANVSSKEGPNTKLRVTFFWPFYGNYWIIGLDPDYRWAVVGEPDRKYLWILSREPRMDESLYQQILHRIAGQGYALDRLMKTAPAGHEQASGVVTPRSLPS
jgi:apolipoprotein D and lipocalin family protein